MDTVDQLIAENKDLIPEEFKDLLDQDVDDIAKMVENKIKESVNVDV